MERIKAQTLINNKIITIDNDSNLTVDNSILNSVEKIIIKERVNCDILFAEISSNCHINIEVNNDAKLVAKGLVNGSNLNVEFSINCGKNSLISMYFVDFSSENSFIDALCNMEQEGSSFTWQMASLATHEDKKKVRVNVEHKVPHLYGDVSNYGVVKDMGKLEIAGVTHISNGARQTLTKQNARIMLIDKASKGIAKPILKIDENDVKASHGATLGQINEDHLFYLKSRGLSESEAKKLIVLGYFNPVILLFKDEECEQYILNLVGERI